MEPILRAEKLTKRFGELTANREIDIEIHAGEIHAIAGENGAGKSTLMKMLYGVYQPTAGNLYIDGEKMERWNPTIAREKGIGMVFQDFRLFAFPLGQNVAAGAAYDRVRAADCLTEAGFGADLGAEKFFDIKCRMAGLKPSAVVIVATVRALKHHGGVAKAALDEENLDALQKGLPNLLRHIDNVTNVFGLPCVVAINRFPADTERELEFIEKQCRALNVNVALSEVWAKGGEGGMALAEEVVRLCEEPNDFSFAYEDDLSIAEKIEAIAQRVYHADGVDFTPAAKKEIAQLEALGFAHMPVCMAKTQYSFSDDQTKLGAPRGFRITVRKAKVSAGAGFIVALTGDIMTMPGLPKRPAAERIDVDETGKISGLF